MSVTSRPTWRDRIYLIVTGAGTARRTPQIAAELARIGPQVIAVMTPNASEIVAPRELADTLAAIDSRHGLATSYFDLKLGVPASPGLVLVAPCSFASLNKLAGGIADNLALSIASDAIGSGWPTFVAPSMNNGLWSHPRARRSIADLREWGVEIIEPVVVDGSPRLAPIEHLMTTVRAGFTLTAK